MNITCYFLIAVSVMYLPLFIRNIRACAENLNKNYTLQRQGFNRDLFIKEIKADINALIAVLIFVALVDYIAITTLLNA